MSATVIKLRNWSVVIPPGANPHMADEHKLSSLAGEAYGHPNQTDFPDGTKIITTGVTSVKGRIAQTMVGNVYELDGLPKPSFIYFLERNGHVFNDEEPLSPKKA